MFYQYEVEKAKEYERRERIKRAEVDRLLSEIEPRRENLIVRAFRGLLHSVGHILLGVGGRLEARGSETVLVR